MAIYHCSVKMVSRSSGRSSVGAVAYRSGEKLYNEYDGITHDYRKKSGIAYSEIMLPNNAPSEFKDRQTLWNSVEMAEKRVNSQTAREVEVALPQELKRHQQIELIREYVQENFINKGMCVDFSIHDKADGNPHAHIMLTTRKVSENGFTDKNRDWNNRANVEIWRENWAKSLNRVFEKERIEQYVDHRSYKRQGVDKVPTVHLGKAHKMEQRGIESERGNMNRDIKQLNLEKQQLEKEYHNARKEMFLEKSALEAERKAKINRPLELDESRNIKQGAIRNSQRNEELETRNWQRSDGLERVEPVVAKETEFTIEPKKEVSRAINIKPISEVQQMSAEKAGQRLSETKYLCINNELKIKNYEKIRENLKSEINGLNGRAESILEHNQNINSYNSKLAELHERKDNVKFYQFGEKKKIDSDIASIEKSKLQAEKSLYNNYGISQKEIPAELEKIKSQQVDILKQIPSEKDLQEYKQEHDILKNVYIAEKQTAMQRSNYEDIKNAERGHDKTFKDTMTMKNNMKVAKFESKATKPNMQELKEVKEMYKSNDIKDITAKREKELQVKSIGSQER